MVFVTGSLPPAQLSNAESEAIKDCINRYNIQSLEQWYSITPLQVLKATNGKLLVHRAQQFNHTPVAFLGLAFPHHQWKEWKFIHWYATSWWKSPANQRKFVDYVLHSLPQQSLQQKLLALQRQHIEDEGGHYLLRMYKSIGMAMLVLYPEAGISSTTPLFSSFYHILTAKIRMAMENTR